MNLVRFRERTKDLHLPDGRVVKVTVNDANTTQHVEELDGRVHGTARPPPIVLRANGQVRQPFHFDEEFRLWAPVPSQDATATPQSIIVEGQ